MTTRYARMVVVPVSCDSCGTYHHVPVKLEQETAPEVALPVPCVCGHALSGESLRDDLIDTALCLVRDRQC